MGKVSGRYLLAVDLEGIHGVFGKTYETLNGSPDYEKAISNAVREINTVVAALFDSGAELVAVWDNHGANENIDFSDLDPRVTEINAKGDEWRFDFAKGYGFDRVIFLGYHAMEGNPRGILAHTYSSVGIQYIKLEGVYMSEFHIDSLICADYGIAPVLVAADDVCLSEMVAVAPEVLTVTTKLAAGRNRGTEIPEEEVLCDLYERTLEAAGTAEFSPIEKMPAPARLEIRYTRAERAAERIEFAKGLGIPVEYGEDSHILRFEITRANQIPRLT